MGFSKDDLYIIDQTNHFFEHLRAGRIDPQHVDAQLRDMTGGPDDYGEDYIDRWEMLIVGTIAHNASQDLGSFPIIICDWTRNKREGNWCWQKDSRPSRRPKIPHRIKDQQLTMLSNKKMGRAATEGEVVVFPLVANYENRYIFEIALLAVFPVWGSWAFRHRVNVSKGLEDVGFRRMLNDYYDWRQLEHRPQDRTPTNPLHKWIVASMPNFGWFINTEYRLKIRSVMEASLVSVPLLKNLAEHYSQK
jgi:hypothetical protein